MEQVKKLETLSEAWLKLHVTKITQTHQLSSLHLFIYNAEKFFCEDVGGH